MCAALSPCSLNGFMMKYIGKEQLTFIYHICLFYNFQRTMQELNNNLDLHFEYYSGHTLVFNIWQMKQACYTHAEVGIKYSCYMA
jgi:hypothetical protein